MLEIDHLTVCAATLDEGADFVATRLGVTLEAGGVHAAMGTHNRLLGLGPGLYLEVIAIDPGAPPPDRPRWFDLDHFSGPPRLCSWVARCADLQPALRLAPPGAGVPMPLARGTLRWQMAVPENGRLPFDSLFPALIQWQDRGHPTQALRDSGCRLAHLELVHPDATGLETALADLVGDQRIAVRGGPHPALRAVIDTPSGPRELS